MSEECDLVEGPVDMSVVRSITGSLGYKNPEEGLDDGSVIWYSNCGGYHLKFSPAKSCLSLIALHEGGDCHWFSCKEKTILSVLERQKGRFCR